jgi:hypothetical protein
VLRSSTQHMISGIEGGAAAHVENQRRRARADRFIQIAR